MIKLTRDQAQRLHDGQVVEGYEGWYLEYDESTGDMDSNYLYDFEIDLYNEKRELQGTAIGGTYSDCEVHFQDGLEFTPPTELSEFNRFLIEIAHNAMSVGSDLAEITAKLTEISQYVSKLTKENNG